MVNWLAVLVTAIINFGIGFVWYGPLFGKVWMKGMRFKPKDVEDGMTPGIIAVAFLAAFIFQAVLAAILKWAGVATFGGGMAIGVVVWLGFAVKMLDSVLWEQKKLIVYWINIAATFVTIVLTSGVLAVW